MNINGNLMLEQAIRNSNTVVHFTHDYFSFVVEKNEIDLMPGVMQICLVIFRFKSGSIILLLVILIKGFHSIAPLAAFACSFKYDST